VALTSLVDEARVARLLRTERYSQKVFCSVLVRSLEDTAGPNFKCDCCFESQVVFKMSLRGRRSVNSWAEL